MTLYLESPCSHGYMTAHVCGCSYRMGDPHPTDCSGDCPGGSRTEVHVDYEAGIKEGRRVAMRTSHDLGRYSLSEIIAAAINAALGLTEGDTL